MEREGYSGLSITSFIFSILGSIFFLLIWVCVAINAQDEIVGLMAILQGFMNLVGIGTGVSSLFSNSQKRIFGILGTTFSVATLIITISVLLYGLSLT